MERTQALQILEANLNRLREGIRVAEDVIRYSPSSAKLFSRAKSLRLASGKMEKELRELLGREIARARRLELDPGKETDSAAEMSRTGESPLLGANLKRAQEAARTLEEVSKVLSLRAFSQQYKKLRFALYALEANAQAHLTAQYRVREFRDALTSFPLNLVLDEMNTKIQSPMQLVSRYHRAGGRVIQVRYKNMPAAVLLKAAQSVAARFPDSLVIVNDRVDVARAANAFGVHVGPQDIPLGKLSTFRGDMLVGYSARTADSAIRAIEAGADYIGVGAVFPTDSKSRTRVAGLEGVRSIAKAVDAPVLAIGGITAANFASVIKAGATACAVISAVADPKQADELYALVRKLTR